ncbi:MAG TPA: hypothetical protein VFJ51_08170 [Nitrososphaeraceae archaeon]|nr:hypothetical protein [Nitrososphaeraceae archaeon]
MVPRAKGNKQVNKNAAKEKSTDYSKHKKMAKARNDLGAGQLKEGVRDKNMKQFNERNNILIIVIVSGRVFIHWSSSIVSILQTNATSRIK